MSSIPNDTVTQLAFVAAFSELTGKNMVGLVKKKAGTTKNPYRVITVYGRLSNNEIITLEGITTEEKVIDKHPCSFGLETNKKEHLMEFMTDPLDLVKFERSVENFKEAITDVYGTKIGICDSQLARSFTQPGEEVCCQMEK